AYKVWRPTPLIRALGLEKVLGTPARIYYKWEGVSPAGSHKPNTAIAQAYYNKAEGTKRLATETGAGQWGSALALAARMFDLECKVYMVRVSYDQKPYRRILMETWGAEVVPSPSPDTKAGRAAHHQGSVRLRLRRRGDDDAAREDAHARSFLHAGAHPRRRTPLPRHGAGGERALRAEADRGGRGPPAADVRGGGHVRARGGV